MIFGTVWSFLMIVVWGIALSGVKDAQPSHLLATFILWLISGPGAVAFFYWLFK